MGAEQIMRLRRELARAEVASLKASESRARLPAGSSRARVTSANAHWARLAEHRDRLLKQLSEAEQEAANG
jgi:hypothetical protein